MPPELELRHRQEGAKMSLKGKIAVITGASRGIGRAIALRFAKDGALVVVNYQKNAAAAAAVVREIESAGGETVAVQGDVGSLAGIRGLFQSLDAELTRRRGSNQFDILVNNAGIGREGTVETTSEEDFDELIAVNLKGPFFVAQQAIAPRDGGRVINLSSALSRIAYPRMAAYSLGKAAINHFTLILAAELGKRGIAVNAIGPGLTVTDFTAQRGRTRRLCSTSRRTRPSGGSARPRTLPAWRLSSRRTIPPG